MSVAGILGKKIGMTQIFDEAAQIGYVDFVKASKINKAMTGHFAKSNVPPVKMIKEVPIEVSKPGQPVEDAVKAGDRVLVDIFNDERFVDVIGTSKGRGFAGVIRRHGFGGGPKSHGHMFQVQGSIGASSFPSRVFPGQRMPGHMGHAQITVRNLRIRGIDVEDNLILVEGAVPGPRDGFVLISKAKAPPRERRGFAGAATKDALKASKKAAPSKKK
jgi:large subunit ribosomal protein L3